MCSQVLVTTCSRCREEFVVHISAETVRELRDKLQTYVCPRCRQSQPAAEALCTA